MLSCLSVILFHSCTDSGDVVYSNFVDVNPKGWGNGEYCVYRLSEVDKANFAIKSAKYDLIITIRHNTRYPFNNLWIVLESPIVVGDSVKSDKINLQLASKSGNWRGHGMQGLYEFSDTIKRNMTLKSDDIISLRHDMPETDIPGIIDVGLTIIRSK